MAHAAQPAAFCSSNLSMFLAKIIAMLHHVSTTVSMEQSVVAGDFCSGHLHKVAEGHSKGTDRENGLSSGPVDPKNGRDGCNELRYQITC